jgi:hypothetical protein
MRSYQQPNLMAWAPPICLASSRRPWNVPRQRSTTTSLNAIANFAYFSSSTNEYQSSNFCTPLQIGVYNWIMKPSVDSTLLESTSNLLSLTSSTTPVRPPTKDEISLLQKAFASFYGTDRNVAEAVDFFTTTISTWEDTRQSGDEIAGLYRVRGDAFMVSCDLVVVV